MITDSLLPVLITGLPRGGTSLVCRLLNACDNTVALDEAMDVSRWSATTELASVYMDIDSFSKNIRDMAIRTNTVISKSVGGVIGENHFGEMQGDDLREDITRLGRVSLQHRIMDDFVLYIKHPAAFSAFIDGLMDRYKLYAVVRNPLAVLLSWNANNMPQRDGFAPAAMKIDLKLKASLEACSDRFDRQLMLISWFFEKFLLLSDDHIIFYEALIATSGVDLKRLTGITPNHHINLINCNNIKRINKVDIRKITEKVLQSDGAYWEFYSRDDVVKLSQKLC